jgi:hypothetical protein
MKNLVSWRIIGALIGGIGGYLYWLEIGCLTGTCPLKSHWQTMVPFGIFAGYTAVDIIQSIYKTLWKQLKKN